MSHDSNDPVSLTIDQETRLVDDQDELKRDFILREDADRRLQRTCDAYEDEIVKLKRLIEAYEVEKISAFRFLKPETLAKGLDQEKIRTSFSWAEWLRDREAQQQKEIDTGKSTIGGLESRIDELERDAGRQRTAHQADLDNARVELKNAEARRRKEIEALSDTIEKLHLDAMGLRSELLILQERYRKEAYRMAAVIALRTQQLAAAQEEAASAQVQITALYASRSWRWGKFVRGLGRAIRSVLGKTSANA